MTCYQRVSPLFSLRCIVFIHVIFSGCDCIQLLNTVRAYDLIYTSQPSGRCYASALHNSTAYGYAFVWILLHVPFELHFSWPIQSILEKEKAIPHCLPIISQTCMLVCRQHTDCGYRQFCYGGVCQQLCSADADCGGTQYCDTYMCRSLCSRGTVLKKFVWYLLYFQHDVYLVVMRHASWRNLCWQIHLVGYRTKH